MRKIFLSFIFFAFTMPAISQKTPNNNLSQSSYENRHQTYPYSDTLPAIANARSFFKYSDGSDGLVISKLVTWPGNATLETAQPTVTTFYRRNNGQWIANNEAVFDAENSVPGCTHSRKIIPADFNQDGVIDFVIACTGWDDRPFPGERSRVLLSQPNGKWRLDYFSSTVAYQHGGATADINGDGYPDLIMTNINGVDVFINDRTGFFVKSNNLSIPQQRRAFIIDLIDISGDGKYDFVAGSHEWEDATRIIINPGNNDFGGSLFNRPTEITIPPVSGAGVIVDFLYVKSVNSLFILRTGDGKSNGTRFYEGVWLQKFAFDTRLSTLVYANPGWFQSNRSHNKWIDWIIEKDGFITSDFGELIKIPID